MLNGVLFVEKNPSLFILGFLFKIKYVTFKDLGILKQIHLK